MKETAVNFKRGKKKVRAWSFSQSKKSLRSIPGKRAKMVLAEKIEVQVDHGERAD